MRTENAADTRLDAMSENCIFYIPDVWVFTQPGSKADTQAPNCDVCFTPDSRHKSGHRFCPLSAGADMTLSVRMSALSPKADIGKSDCANRCCYSIKSSAHAALLPLASHSAQSRCTLQSAPRHGGSEPMATFRRSRISTAPQKYSLRAKRTKREASPGHSRDTQQKRNVKFLICD